MGEPSGHEDKQLSASGVNQLGLPGHWFWRMVLSEVLICYETKYLLGEIYILQVCCSFTIGICIG